MMNLDDFQSAIEDSNGEYYGEYNGRCHFVGYAGSFDSSADLIKLGAYLQEQAKDGVEGAEKLIKYAPHIDSLGRGIVVAWPAKFFDGDAA